MNDGALPPPYQPTAGSNDVAEPPSYTGAPSASRQTAATAFNASRSFWSFANPFRSPAAAPPGDITTDVLDVEARLVLQHILQPQSAQPAQPPPDYYAASSTDCPHWVARRCRLTARPRQCCTCMDKRPETEGGRYPVYIDGYAELGSVVRWAHYCTACRDAESRLHGCYSTRAWPPPRPHAHRPSPWGNKQARAALAAAEASSSKPGAGEAGENGERGQDANSRWETAAERKRREKQERQWSHEQAEKRKDDAWEAEQLKRLLRGQSVAGIIARQRFLLTNPGYIPRAREDDGKGKAKQREMSALPWEAAGPAMKPITPADVRAARKMWEACDIVDECERKRWDDIQAGRGDAP